MNSCAPNDNAGVIAFPPFIWAGCAVASAVVHFLSPHRLIAHAISLPLGLLSVVLAPSLALWAFRTMKAAGTNIDPAKPALTIVRDGPYRFTRNPMYLALCLLQLAVAFLLDDWSALLFLIPLALLLHHGVILREEKYLEAKFGATYLALKRDVRRWL